MIKLKDGSFIKKETITAIRVLDGIYTEEEHERQIISPRVVIEFLGKSIVIKCETLAEAKEYAEQIHIEISTGEAKP